MIEVKLFKNSNSDIYAFEMLNHAETFVCAGVSMLVLNTINAIEVFTDTAFILDFDEQDGGRLTLCLPEIEKGEHFSDVALLTNTLELGLDATLEEYPNELVIYKEVQQC